MAMLWLTCFLNHIMNIKVPLHSFDVLSSACNMSNWCFSKKKYNHITSEEYAPMFILLSEQQLNQFPFFAFSSTKIVRASLWNASVAATTREREPVARLQWKTKKTAFVYKIKLHVTTVLRFFSPILGFLMVDQLHTRLFGPKLVLHYSLHKCIFYHLFSP